MSRTDAHRPYDVWVADHPELVREIHDHRRGVCSLGAAPDSGSRPARAGSPLCYLELAWQIRLCSCPMCSGSFDRAHARAARRNAERTWLSAARGGADEREVELLEGRVRYLDVAWR